MLMPWGLWRLLSAVLIELFPDCGQLTSNHKIAVIVLLLSTASPPRSLCSRSPQEKPPAAFVSTAEPRPTQRRQPCRMALFRKGNGSRASLYVNDEKRSN